MIDILIRNGEVIDGSGTKRFKADVAILGDRIVEVGNLSGASAGTVIDATGHVVTPGFVDMHSHADMSLPVTPTADSLVRQGITTIVPFQCGSSLAPIVPAKRKQFLAMMEEDEQLKGLPLDRWSSFGSFLDYLLEIGVSLNVVPLVGQSTIRTNVMEFSAAAPTAQQMADMQQLVVDAMNEGALGLTTGLIYPPGSFAGTQELIDITHPVGQRNGYYFSHIRGESGTLLTAIEEAIRIGKETGASVEISHFKVGGRENWHNVHTALGLIDKALSEGQDVTADLYPYMAGSTSLVTMLPEWAQDGGAPATLRFLQDADTRKKIVHDMRTTGYFKEAEWDKVLICASPKNRTYEGHYIAELAADAKKVPTDWVMDSLIETKLDLGMIIFQMSDENRKIELKRPWMMIGTDGYGMQAEKEASKGGLPHPRSYGTFPCILGRYVREMGVLTLEEAVHKMSGLPAKKLRWTDRGLLQKGYKADVVVFDPKTVVDNATFQKPHQYPTGIPYVLVNGRLVVRGGAHTGARPGEMLRRK